MFASDHPQYRIEVPSHLDYFKAQELRRRVRSLFAQETGRPAVTFDFLETQSIETAGMVAFYNLVLDIRSRAEVSIVNVGRPLRQMFRIVNLEVGKPADELSLGWMSPLHLSVVAGVLAGLFLVSRLIAAGTLY